MDAAPPTPDLDAALAELTTLNLRMANVLTRVAEVEQAMVDVAATWLPTVGTPAASLGDAIAAGQAMDSVSAVMAAAVTRLDTVGRALDRVSRSARRCVALRRRLQTGWPRAGISDDRPAMLRRQVANRVREKIRQHADGEATERMFDDLATKLDDPALDEELQAYPVEVVVQRMCRDLGLAIASIERTLHPAPSASTPPHPPDTG